MREPEGLGRLYAQMLGARLGDQRPEHEEAVGQVTGWNDEYQAVQNLGYCTNYCTNMLVSLDLIPRVQNPQKRM